MRALKGLFVAVMLMACLPATAQFGRTECANEYIPAGASNPTYRTCLQVSNTNPEVGESVNILAWLFSQPAGGFNIATTFSLYDGSFFLLTQGTAVHQTLGNALDVNFVFTSAGTVQLRADPAAAGRLDSPTIPITVRKFSPRYSMTFAPLPTRTGQSIQITTDTTLHRPAGGVLVFYVTRPGGTAVEFARKTVSVTGPANVIDHDVRSFPFVAPNDIPGEYIFMARYLGDAINDAVFSAYFRLPVGPHPTTTSLAQDSTLTLTAKPVILTATVGGALGGLPVPSGNVEFLDGTTLLGSAALTTQGTAQFTARLAGTGAHSLTARYVGDFNYQASTSAAIAHEVRFDPALLVPIFELLLN
jgi:hypothetical protein